MQRNCVCSLCLALCCGLPGHVHAQNRATVQLPSFSQFSLRTVVSVPDRGSAPVGGVNRSWRRSSTRRASFTPALNRSYAGGVSASGLSVHAQIIDHAELDEQILQRWRLTRDQRRGIPENQQVMQQRPQKPPTIRAARQQQKAQDRARLQRAERDFFAGQQAEREGKTGVAKVYYRMALKGAGGDLRSKVQSRLSRLGSTSVLR